MLKAKLNFRKISFFSINLFKTNITTYTTRISCTNHKNVAFPNGGMANVSNIRLVGSGIFWKMAKDGIRINDQNIYGTITLLNLFLIKSNNESFLVINNAPLRQTKRGTQTSLNEYKNKE